MDMLKRIEALEKVMTPPGWEDVELHIIETDASETGEDKTGKLSIVIKSGTPGRSGRSYYRGENETEGSFLKRIAEEEARR